MEKIYLLRHAITDAHVSSRKNPTMGFANIGLNEDGKKAAEFVGKELLNDEIEGIICSDLLSAKETAEIIGNILQIPIYSTELLRERNQGIYTGRLLEEIYKENKDFSITTVGKGRENLHSFMKRTQYAIDQISRDFCWKNCLIVSHKGFLRTFMATCIGVNPGNWYLCEMRKIIYDKERARWFEIH